jgi:hypothetical protein
MEKSFDRDIDFDQPDITYYLKHLKEYFLTDRISENLKNVKIIG